MSRSNIRKFKPAAAPSQGAPEPGREAGLKARRRIPNLVTFDQPVSLADQKFELTRIKLQMEEELARIDAELKRTLADGEVVYSHHGVGYRLSMVSQDVYDPHVIRELSRMRMLPKFVRVSTTRLRELVSEGRLSQRKFEALRERYARAREIPTLREVPLESDTQAM